MKFFVRNEYGELMVPTYAELRVLYTRQFISDDDEIRRDGSDRWVRAGDMPDLRMIKPRPWFQGFEFAWLSIAICVITLVIIFVMKVR